MSWVTQDTRGLAPFPLLPYPEPPSSSSNRIHFQNHKRIKNSSGRTNATSARPRALQQSKHSLIEVIDVTGGHSEASTIKTTGQLVSGDVLNVIGASRNTFEL
ncbi:hypothetical protein AMTR_s00038p00237590 [Amborella trichopoda]|uniref:Uncharacterized protein n=1 Tax=Amborella trichopoda TaxID=13333 RepID=U5D310_AMBTC|nr:hypothetical protein AMTR_s00038p00237590 [Amborella trichopoda]